MAALATRVSHIGKSARSAFVGILKFLARPDLAVSGQETPVTKPVLFFWLLVFSFTATAFFSLLALPLIVFSEVELGENLSQVLDRPALSILVALVVLGPLVEEMIFRGWLTGTYRALIGTAAFLSIFYGGASLLPDVRSEPLGVFGQIGVSMLAFLIFHLIERNGTQARPAFYTAFFPYIFWLQGIVFGGLHFANLAGSSFILPFLATAPLVICGWLFAYARIVLGFGSAWLLHALYNIPPALVAILIPVADV